MLNELASIITSVPQIPVYRTDQTKFDLINMTTFFERVASPFTSVIRAFRPIDRPSSSIYNMFLNAIENDVNLIMKAQDQIKTNLLSSWNVLEHSTPTQLQLVDPYDHKILTENSPAFIASDRITLGVSSFISANNNINGVPYLISQCSDENITPFFGKAWGSYIKGSENSEDGIRYIGNNGALIVDNANTFWEVEYVVLQDVPDDTVCLQPVTNEDVVVTVNLKVMYTSPMNINVFTINPYNFGVNAYYKLTKLVVSDGVKLYDLNIVPTTISGITSIILELPNDLTKTIPTPIQVQSIYATLVQNTGYFEKYSVAYYQIGNNSTWIDITGPHVVAMTTNMSGNFNTNISTIIENASGWLLNYWFPGMLFSGKPQLLLEYGTEGYKVIPSTISKRKRFAIGITDLYIGQNNYENRSELITNSIDIPTNTNTITLNTIDEGNITYQVSFDDGMTWTRIIPNGGVVVDPYDASWYPTRIYINSDLSATRIKNTDTAGKGFVYGNYTKVRLRMILQKDIKSNKLPAIYDWKLEFSLI